MSGPLAGHIGPKSDAPDGADLLATGEHIDAAAAKLAAKWPSIDQGMLALLLDCFDAGFRAGVAQAAALPDPPPTTQEPRS